MLLRRLAWPGVELELEGESASSSSLCFSFKWSTKKMPLQSRAGKKELRRAFSSPTGGKTRVCTADA